MKLSRLLLTLGAFSIAACLHASAHDANVRGDSYVRAVLLAGKFRSPRELNAMPADVQRNALIVELAGRMNESVAHFQSLDDARLAGTGALLVFLRESRIRRDEELKAMGEGELRSTMIAEMGPQNTRDLQLHRLDNMGLVRVALGISPQ